jgi:hypothetical protein
MKESTIIVNFKKAENERLQNNQMIMRMVDDLSQLQQMVSGFLGVIRKLPGYEDAIKEMSAEHEAAKKKAEQEAADEAANVEVVDAEEVKPTLDLGADD